MSADEVPVETPAVEAEPEVVPDPQALVWIVHPEVAVPGRVRRADVKVVWVESGWREATDDEAAAFDAQALAGRRPTIDGEGTPIDADSIVVDPVVARLQSQPPVVVSDPDPSPARPKRASARKH